MAQQQWQPALCPGRQGDDTLLALRRRWAGGGRLSKAQTRVSPIACMARQLACTRRGVPGARVDPGEQVVR